MLMGHNFAAHALEAAEQDGPWLRELLLAAIEDRTAPPRRSPAAVVPGPPAAGIRW